MRAKTLLVLLVATSCGRFQLHDETGGPEPARPPAQRPTISARPPAATPITAPTLLEPGASRPVPYPVFDSKGFARAVARGTRTRNGQPGPNYWQQFARYRIEAELVPATNQVNGRETVRYYNRSPDTLRVPRFFLNQNLFKPGAARTEEVPVTSGMEILRVAATGQTLSKADSGIGYWIEGTVMGVHLPRPPRAARLGGHRRRVGVSGPAGRRPA